MGRYQMNRILRIALLLLVALSLSIASAQEVSVPASPTEAELPDWMKKRLKTPKTGNPAPGASSVPAASPSAPEMGLSSLYPAAVPVDEEEGLTAFGMGTLVSSRFVKPTEATERFRVGINTRIAVVRAVTKSQLSAFEEANPEVGEVIELARGLDLDKFRRSNPDEIEAQFLAIQGLSDEEKAAIEAVDFQKEQAAIATLVEVANDPEEAITFGFEPYLNVNFEHVGLTFTVPLAGFSHGDEASFELGNLSLDTRMGHYAELPGAVAGISYGLALSAPTGTSRSDSVALSSVLESPKFRHAYFGAEPYLVLGMDAKYVIIQGDVGVSSLTRVRTDNGADQMSYFRYGGAFSLVPFEVIALTVEINGAVNISDADAFSLTQLTGAFRFRVFDSLEPAIAIQAPLSLAGREAYGNTGEMAFGSPADINVFASLSAGF